MLSYRGFSFSYPAQGNGDGCLVLNDVHWEVSQGSFAVLVGPTGCGKTTLLKNAVPALRPAGKRGGHITIGSADVDDLDLEQGTRAVGYVAQNPDTQIVCDTVWHQMAFGLENLGVPQDEMRRSIAELSHFLGTASWFERKTEELSGGQRQLLNLASVLVMKPPLLLLDEPTAMLDPVAEKNFLHMLMRLNKELGITVVVATHSPTAFLPYADAFFAFNSGSEGSIGRLTPGQVRSSSLKLEPDDSSLATASDAGRYGQCNEQKAIELADVYVRYGRKSPFVLQSLDLQVRQGSITAVIGGNGCGKSTLLRVVSALIKPERGRVRNALKARQALLPQDPQALFVCDSVADELREWQQNCGYSATDIEHMLKAYGLVPHAGQHPYDLSGGQQQLLALAKLELTDPDLLLLDEPTKGLDPMARLQVLRSLRRMQGEGKTVVFVTHDLSFASLAADEVALLFDGQIACIQPTGEFFANSVFYRPEKDSLFNAFTAITKPCPREEETLDA